MADDDQDNHWLGHRDEGTSPIVVVAMSAAKVTLYFLAGLVLLVLLIFLWKHQQEGWVMAQGDWGMIGVLTALTLLCIFIARKIADVLEQGR